MSDSKYAYTGFLVGTLVGGALGATAYYFLKKTNHKKFNRQSILDSYEEIKPTLHKLISTKKKRKLAEDIGEFVKTAARKKAKSSSRSSRRTKRSRAR